MANPDSEQSLTPQHPPRPPIHSQHSNSVPSTPYQQPRDLRFHSRSPSPGRRLRNNSPQSTVSEAVGRWPAPRSNVTVCKFEQGAEIRKRRIPYVEGGNEELGPPAKEPKKSLEPEEEEKLGKQMDDLYQRLLPSDESEERRAQLVEKLDRILNEEWPGNAIRVNVFGSSGNLLSSSDSDVDICITTPFKKLETMHQIAGLLHKSGMEKVVCRASAKVPIVKCWDPELKLAADLNVNNPLALENTRMIKTYVQLDDRVRPLAKIIKYWTKRRILNDAAFGGTISSYTWICMILSFLQRRDPPILPSLQKTPGRRKKSENDESPKFADDIESLKQDGNTNTETLPELLFQFFRHYGYEFDYSKYVVSVKEGRLLSRKEKGWEPDNYADKEARNRLCVEEPFTVIRNLGNSADDYAWSGIHGEIRRAFDILADGGLLEKCCEEYQFPQEEKPLFQRPTPKPKPTLTRSASQSGRTTHDAGSTRSRKGGNRNQSAQRAGNRRASSGAAFSSQRGPFMGPASGASVVDYFGLKGDLHNQLYQQWQYLQAQTEALKSQLAAQQQQSASSQGQGRSGDLGGSPDLRSYQNGSLSSRYMHNGPPTAPLLPGYLYHYPARYPPPSPMSQARTREGGTSTNPSSPSLVAAVPALRRQVHRGSIPDVSNSSMRSQSQPGRSLPHPLTLQQQVHPGYDVSGALPGQYHNIRSASGAYTSVPPGIQMPFSPTSMATYAPGATVENAIPKEYVGYYVGQSPSLGPQYPMSAQQMQMPPMTLRDPPSQRQRRVTPDLMPPLPNGKHSSRSPSPLGHLRSYSTAGDLRTAHAQQGLQSPPAMFDISSEPIAAPLAAAPVNADTAGPLIVNGSGTPARPGVAEDVNGILNSSQHLHDDIAPLTNGTGLSRIQSLPNRPHLDTTTAIPEQVEPTTEPEPISPRILSSPRTKSGSSLKFSPNGTPMSPNETSDHFHESTPVGPAPLLSPVAELRTPSPTHSTAFDKDSPTTNGLTKAAKIANARQAWNENDPPSFMAWRPTATSWTPTKPGHERKGSAPNPSSTAVDKILKSPILPTPPATAPSMVNGNGSGNAGASQNANPWQQVPGSKKGHKKSKSSATVTAGSAAGGDGRKGQVMPTNEAERKGG